MKCSRIGLAPAILLLSLLSVGAQVSKTKKIKLEAGVEIGGIYEIERKVKTTMSGGSQDHIATEDYTLTVAPSGREGKDKLVSSRVNRVRIETNATGDGKRIAYDSADRNKQHPSLAEMGKAMLGVTSTAVYGEDNVFKSFGAGATDERSQRAMQQLTDLGFPDEPVGPGDTWKHRIEAEFGQVGQVVYDLDYTFTKMAKLDGADCALLSISGEMNTVPGARANEGFDLTSRSLSGVMYFDPELGAVRKFEINAKVDINAYGKKMGASMTMSNVLKKFSKR